MAIRCKTRKRIGMEAEFGRRTRGEMKILQAEYLLAAAQAAGCPQTDLPEFAFVGRSNVGKSSLINLLLGRKNLARSSATPGKTRLIQFFRIVAQSEAKASEATVGGVVEPARYEFVFADLPGYGYAKVSKAERESWRHLIEEYLATRPMLRAVLLLQDVRRDLREEEIELLDWFAHHHISVLVVLTKLDKLTNREARQRTAALEKAFALPHTQIFATSAEKRLGASAVLDALEKYLPTHA